MTDTKAPDPVMAIHRSDEEMRRWIDAWHAAYATRYSTARPPSLETDEVLRRLRLMADLMTEGGWHAFAATLASAADEIDRLAEIWKVYSDKDSKVGLDDVIAVAIRAAEAEARNKALREAVMASIGGVLTANDRGHVCFRGTADHHWTTEVLSDQYAMGRADAGLAILKMLDPYDATTRVEIMQRRDDR